MICCGFLVGQFDGELVDGIQIYIETDFIGASNKHLLQAIDTKQNKLSIKTSKTFSNFNYKLIIDFNGLTCNVSSDNYSYFGSDGIFILSIEFVFKQNNLYYYLYPFSNENLCLSNIHIVSNSINNKEPTIKQINGTNARDLQQMRNQTKIWFGYSNKIINNFDNNSDWSNINNEFIIGCVDRFYVNDKQIKLEMKGDNNYFYNYCWMKGVIESICNQYGKCRNESIYFQHILDCNKYGSLSLEMNTIEHCYRDLSNISINLLNSYEQTYDDTKSIIAKLAWITQQSINQCLLEIITRNNSLIEIYLDSSNQIILAIKNDKSINWSKHILFEISSNQIHILRIEFTETNTTFKVSNGYFIKKLILPQLGPVKFINVGWNLGINSCQKLTTKFVFRYDSKQFKLLNDSNVKHFLLKALMMTQQGNEINSTNNLLISLSEFYKVHSWIIFLIMIISVSCLILICIGCISGKIKKRKENIPRSTLNIYKRPIEMNNLAPSTCAAIEERNNIYDE